MVQVARMNELTSEDESKIPFPAKQQLGDHGGLKDARSGNGVNDYDLTPETGGHSVHEVTYHLGNDEGTSHAQRAQDAGHQDTTMQREVSGRNERIAEAHGRSGTSQQKSSDQSSSDESDGGGKGDSSSSGDGGSTSTSDVPNGSVQEVLDWVGDDKQRARAALEAEQQRSTPRQRLMSQLNERV